MCVVVLTEILLHYLDGTAFASIWLNTTFNGQNGTFIPLSNPAVSGERVYFVAAFKPFRPVDTIDVHLRLYAIDVRPIMVERIKVIWYYDLTLHESNLPYLTSDLTECIGRSDPTDPQVGSVLFEKEISIVVASVNYVGGSKCSDGSADPSNMKSVVISVTDRGDHYTMNWQNEKYPPFQALAYASPYFTMSDCRGLQNRQQPIDPPHMWVSWVANGTRSIIEKIDIITGYTVYKMDNKVKELQNITVSSRLAIFYNDKKLYCNGSVEDLQDKPLTPLVFGYYDWKDSTNYVGAVDLSTIDSPEFLWKVRTFDENASVVGQIATVGKGRSTMMALTTTHGAYFYVLFAEK